MSKNLRDQSSSIERSARQKRYSAPPSFEQHAMYSAKGSSAPYNGEKQKKECNAISVERRAVRLLSRRYTLTATGYKFLEIGINVGPPSYVEIALGDHRGQELILSLETWKGLYEQRWNIYKLLLNDYKDNFISVGPLTVRICLMNDVTLVRLESLNVRVTMIESTLRRMFALNECIDVTFDRLVRFVDTIDTKYTRFSNIASVVTDPEETERDTKLRARKKALFSYFIHNYILIINAMVKSISSMSEASIWTVLIKIIIRSVCLTLLAKMYARTIPITNALFINN
ncbi:hypothetical protein P5V15_008324 [Pogonomyrmex californicus]